MARIDHIALLLQPIVENAVKYGVAGAPPPAAIAISAWSEDSRLFLRVTDSGKGKKSSGGAGIGLANIRERLNLIYGEDRTELVAGRRPDDSFQVQLTMPMRP